jgi:hypothetical protein
MIPTNIQSIFFFKDKYNLDSCIDYLIKNNLDNYKRVNEDRFYYRYTYQSRIKLQNKNYMKQVHYIDNGNIKIEYYIKPQIIYDFVINLN